MFGRPGEPVAIEGAHPSQDASARFQPRYLTVAWNSVKYRREQNGNIRRFQVVVC